MDTAIVVTRVTQLLREIFNQPDLRYDPALTAADVEEWDSLTHVDLIVAAEAEFHIKLTTGEVRGLKNVGDLVSLIVAKAK